MLRLAWWRPECGVGGDEVRLRALVEVGTARVPEPSTYAFLLAGLALVVARTRRRAVVPSANGLARHLGS